MRTGGVPVPRTSPGLSSGVSLRRLSLAFARQRGRNGRGRPKGACLGTGDSKMAERQWMSSRRERELTERLVQLSCILAEEDEEVPDIPDNACETWTEADVREYYRSKGAYTPEGEFAQGLVGQEVPGGSLEQNRKLRWSDPMDDIGTPPLDAAAYQEAAFEHGIPCRPDGLFPPSDPTLERLTKDPLFKPFEKQLVDKVSRPPSSRLFVPAWL
mmetsp:Transcript_4851/g.14479  ORF Transcript_4851/g.14479 Transcript_4851/m.14479 type:complete len:214 (-) Transcript_4851:1538-2179(-)